MTQEQQAEQQQKRVAFRQELIEKLTEVANNPDIELSVRNRAAFQLAQLKGGIK